jgi:predicted porin
MRLCCLSALLLISSVTLGPAAALAQSEPSDLAPGSFEFHLNGIAQFALGDVVSSLNAVPKSAKIGRTKQLMVAPELHIRPELSSETKSGIEYGSRAEILTPFSDQGGGESGKFGASQSSLRVIDVNRAYGYVGTDTIGTFRAGLTDSAFTLLQTGVIEGFGDGAQWTLQGGPASRLPRNAAPTSTIIYADQPALYSTPKIVYISPAFGNATFAVGFEPAANGIKEGFSPNTVAESDSEISADASILGDIGTKREDTVDAAASDVLSAGPVQAKLMGGVLHGSAVQDRRNASGLAGSIVPHYDALTAYQFGGQLQYAGLTIGGNVKGGELEDGYALVPHGARAALAYSIGSTYELGPVVIGASYFNAQSAGAFVASGAGIARTLSEYGIAAGANYIYSPHVEFFAEDLYGHRHQPGNVALLNGNAQAQLLALGTTISW